MIQGVLIHMDWSYTDTRGNMTNKNNIKHLTNINNISKEIIYKEGKNQLPANITNPNKGDIL